jgi:MFS family permease
MAASGAGAVGGALYLAARRSVVGLGRTIAHAALAFGAGLVAFALSHNLALSLALLVVTGFGMMLQMAASNTVLQTIVEDDKRGRVMSMYTMAFMGMAPFGSLLAGGLASGIGAANTLIAGGVVCMVAALAFARQLPTLRTLVRPIYIRKGILPAISAGLQDSAEPALHRMERD